MEYEYKVIDVADGSISSALLGEGRIETSVLESYLNVMASEGWRVVFMANVLQRHLVLSDRETLMITFERKVPFEEQQARASRCLDDVIAAEDYSQRVGKKAAVGALGLAAGSVILGSILSNSDNS